MKIAICSDHRVYDLKNMQECEISDSTIVALGTFDGCHIGHMSVFRSAFLLAKKQGFKAIAYTFNTIPKAIATKSIMTLDEKIRFIRKSGLDYIAIDDFSSVKNMSGKEFVDTVLKQKLKAKGALCGYNYRFGKNASCTGEDLKRFFENGEECVDICGQVSLNNVPVSSTLIREKIENGDLEELLPLCPPYSVLSQVIEGKKLGRTIGIPTINQLIPKEKITPKRGVYITECEIGEDVYPAVTNVGTRPTVENDGFENMETYIIGYSGDLYYSYIRVNFYKRLRDEKKFNSLTDLKNQINSDIELAKQYFK